MNVKALAAIVGTLSLGALVTGCASNKAAEGAGSTEAAAKGTEAACKGAGEAAAPAGDAAAPTPEKGGEGKCGEGKCSGAK